MPGPEQEGSPADEAAPPLTPLQHEILALRQRLATLEAADTAAFQHTVEALQRAEEELRAQNDALHAMRVAVEQERDRYVALFTLAPDGYLVTDAAGVVQEVNQAAAVLLGRPAEDLVGKPLVLAVVEADRPTFQTLLTRLTRQQRVPPWETHLQPLQGDPLPVSLTVAVDPPPPQPVRGLYWLVRDLTAAKQADADRQRLAQEVQRTQHFALLGRLAAGVSHEIRNPLAVVFLHVDLVEEELRAQAPEAAALVAEMLTEIRTHLARLEDLVQDYLAAVRASQLERTLQDLGDAVQAWAADWEQMASPRGVTLQCDGLEALGLVAFHASTLRRALRNVVQNALDAMPDGGLLTLRGRRQGATVQLDVSDTGSGIPPELHARIFEPLQTTKPGGTGLGLYIVQEVVAAHGGHVAVQSTVGVGTTLTITLPLAGT
jgi:PAS domain S-box-containing protein